VQDASAARSTIRVDKNSQERLDEIKRCLTENESQRTEVAGHINQLSIQLHRWQLRLQTLNQRKQQLEAELRKTEQP
jgi:predicted nuclease with TOPRIM domain